MATLKETKINLFSYSTIRYVGYIVAFVGIMLLLIGRISSTFIQLISVALLLTGILLISENIKKLYKKDVKKEQRKEKFGLILLGILLIVLSIILYYFGGQISKWIDLFFGISLSIYSLVLLIYFASKKTIKKSRYVFNIVLFSLFLLTGVLISMLFVVTVSTFLLITGICATLSGLLALIVY